jgi:putative transposase
LSSAAATAYHRARHRTSPSDWRTRDCSIHLEEPRSSVHNLFVKFRGFASKLHHEVPHWVEVGALFHIRIRVDLAKQQPLLVDPPLAHRLLDSARFYESRQRWHITVFLLMPDHLHAVLSFARDESMRAVIGDWKHFHKRENQIRWQEGFFDHRLRDDERGEQRSAKLNYIRNNPIAAGLCAKANDWPWIIDPSRD